jgi:hypothetical protein
VDTAFAHNGCTGMQVTPNWLASQGIGFFAHIGLRCVIDQDFPVQIFRRQLLPQRYDCRKWLQFNRYLYKNRTFLLGLVNTK